MSSTSRWAAADPEEEAAIAQRKREKEAKKRAKAERQRLEEHQQKQKEAAAAAAATVPNGAAEDARPTKRRRLSTDSVPAEVADTGRKLLRFPSTEWSPCRHVDNYERLNHIEEGSYGLVSRAKDLATGEIVALKKLKIDNAPDGFPVTGLREIQTLQRARHVNVVKLREIVMGNSMNECVPPIPSLLVIEKFKIQDY
jgi:cell division cycle 2-like protein